MNTPTVYSVTDPKGHVVRTKAITILAVAAAIASAALTFLPWIDISDLGMPIRWNGLGMYVGEHVDHYVGGMVNSPPGWIVLIASIAAAGTLLGATRLRWLGFIACGCALVAFAAAALSLVYPALVVGGVKHELGVSELEDRDLLNSGALITEVATTAVLVVCTALIAAARRTR